MRIVDMMKRSKIWFDGLQVLRTIAFCLVYLSHSGAYFETCGEWGVRQFMYFLFCPGF